MGRVVHFEILADNLDRAKKFYEDAFGWKVQSVGIEQYYLITTSDDQDVGINGAIMPRIKIFDSKEAGYRAYVCTIQVENLNETIEKIKGAGGKILNKKNAIAHIGTHIYAQDTEGNALGILQPPNNS